MAKICLSIYHISQENIPIQVIYSVLVPCHTARTALLQNLRKDNEDGNFFQKYYFPLL